MRAFAMNGYLWHVKFVDPSSDRLIDRTERFRVATTNPMDRCIYLSKELHGDFLNRVLIHELGHCALISFGLLNDIHRMVKREYWFEAEEWVCNFIADYGLIIFKASYSILGDKAWMLVPREIEKLIA